MVMGTKKEDLLATGSVDAHIGSRGVTADGEVEGNSFSPTGNAGVHHWQTP